MVDADGRHTSGPAQHTVMSELTAAATTTAAATLLADGSFSIMGGGASAPFVTYGAASQLQARVCARFINKNRVCNNAIIIKMIVTPVIAPSPHHHCTIPVPPRGCRTVFVPHACLPLSNTLARIFIRR